MKKQYKVGIYCRLSVDDASNSAKAKNYIPGDESASIENQHEILSKFVMLNGWIEVKTYRDDGYSGGNFQRPGFLEMLEDARHGLINLILVKDLSRLGRDFVEVGRYTDVIFPSLGCRFVSVLDCLDSEGDNTDMLHFRSLMNDYHLKDLSGKIKSVLYAKKKSGQYLTAYAPYGYRKSDEDKHRLVVDEEAAAVVKRIFDLCVAGKGPMQIAKILKADKVLTTRAHYAKQKGKSLPDNPYSWNESTIVAVLERMDYCGHTVNFKSYSKSHKLKKRIPTTKEQQAIFRNTHEAIVEEAVFERVQELRANKRRPTKAERQGMFSGLVFCADCGSKLHFATCKSFDGSQDNYRCARYKSNTGDCTAHFIREEVLRKIVLNRIFAVTAMFYEDITAFMELIQKQRFDEAEKDMKRKRREVGQARKRIAELDRIFKRIYEDDINGTISHERFLKLSAEYETEQKELTEKVNAEQQEVDTYEQNKSDFDSFAAIIRKYVGITELTPTIVNEFVKKIVVHAPEKIDGKRFQKVDIVFNFVGEIHLPTDPQTEQKETDKQEKTA